MFQGQFSKFMPFRTRGIKGYPTIPHSTTNSKKNLRASRAHPLYTFFARAPFFFEKTKRKTTPIDTVSKDVLECKKMRQIGPQMMKPS